MDQDSIKKELIRKYLFLIVIFFITYGCVYLSSNLNKLIIYYIAGGLLLVFLCILLADRNYAINKVIQWWLIAAPVYMSVYFIVFWKYSFMSFIWLLPIPFAAYIFFSIKTVIYYTIGILIYIILIIIIAEKINYQGVYFTRLQLLTSDILVVICNVSVIILLLIYLDKLKVVSFSRESDKNINKDVNNEKINNSELIKYKELFNSISDYIETKKPFKKSDFTISNLATALNSNNSYISKAIKLEGYSNFNNYLNSHRIKYVKELIKEEKQKSYTLLYVYTEAGFTSQSTFNRVFKQFEGVNPSEYIKINTK